MEKQLCMLIKLPTVCKKRLMKLPSRTKQINYNTANNLTPQALNKKDSAFTKKPASGLRVRNSLNAAQNQKTCTYLNLKLKN
jgi:excinuclease UvrABC helicase subunit UvrB